MNFLLAPLRNESGATAIEYGLIGGLLSIAIVIGLSAVSIRLDSIFMAVSTAF